MASETESLNPNQKRRLRVTCEHIDKLLSGAEAVLWESESKAAFPRHLFDISPKQRLVIEDYISTIRARLVQTLEGQAIPREPPSISATHALQADLTFVDIALEELRPRHMRGYGEVPARAGAELDGVVGELQGLVAKLDEYLRGGRE